MSVRTLYEQLDICSPSRDQEKLMTPSDDGTLVPHYVTYEEEEYWQHPAYRSHVVDAVRRETGEAEYRLLQDHLTHPRPFVPTTCALAPVHEGLGHPTLAEAAVGTRGRSDWGSVRRLTAKQQLWLSAQTGSFRITEVIRKRHGTGR